MRLITYNLHKGRGYGRRRRQDILIEAMQATAELRPDLLLCQEVFHGKDHSLPQSGFITAQIGHPHVFAANAFYERGCHGNATFARFPVAAQRNVDVTESFLEKRGILHTTLVGEGGRPFDVLNTHFSLTGRQRRRQWFKLQQCLPEDRALPVIVAGDLNDWGGGLDRRARRSGVLRNALWSLPRAARMTFPARAPFFAMDRVYTRGFEVREARVLRGAPWSGLSDHLPILVDLEPVAASASTRPAT